METVPMNPKRRNYVAQQGHGDKTEVFWKSVQETPQASRKETYRPRRKINKECLSDFLHAKAEETQAKVRSSFERPGCPKAAGR